MFIANTCHSIYLSPWIHFWECIVCIVPPEIESIKISCFDFRSLFFISVRNTFYSSSIVPKGVMA